MGSDFSVRFSKQDENTLLESMKNFREHNIKIPEEGIPVPLSNDSIILIKGAKNSGVEGGFVFQYLCDRNAKITDESTYMGKVMFSSKNISGIKYSKPNAKSKIAAMVTKRTKNEVNHDVIQEYVSLKLANTVYNGIAPKTKLGEISDDGRLFLMTQMQGQKENENFATLGELNNVSSNNLSDIPKEQWKAAYAVTVGLLNDSDANKHGNIGATITPFVDQNGKYSTEKKLSLFDLGHPNPNKFSLDSNFLPTAKTKIGQTLTKISKNLHIDRPLQHVYTMESFIQNKLSAGERKEALEDLCSKEKDVFKCLDEIKAELGSKGYKTDVVLNFQKELKKRFEYLKKVTGYHPSN